MNWLMAHRVAGIAAANLRRRLDLPEDRYVDVFAALRSCGLMVAGQDMPSLFGMYFPPGPSQHGGIFLNSAMSEATIRHTAAHELGHAELGHGRCLADGPDFTAKPPQQWPDEEKQAEAFAAWFLMPIRAVKTTLTRLGLDIPREAMDVYQLSLHLGTSYRGTLRHVQHLRMVRPEAVRGWAAVQPARLRARLGGQAASRVWDLSGLTEGCRLPVEPGDRLVVRAPWLGADPEFTGPDAIVMLAEPRAVAPGDGVEFDIIGCIESESVLTVRSRDRREVWSVTLMPTPDDHRGLIASARSQLLVGPMSGARR
ncbi:ImmA/IrrE family metallo-endopeptidase [Verrucosispora sp. WMMC514]|uniref:ImmA/IrrE family metallo-endopeptidase n=1 Tax=Verrucosispora sp. WMMC514 TaxID=3015156 RepID=UPI00248AB66B|nr:ImmA/IrrE family metallo-endopeptidase [Verrucosispora sp. WMMC514]WBB93349.1 ImmA/IrrE family metallo-endopeptidase [Verrucosispora sp. WMMC514]